MEDKYKLEDEKLKEKKAEWEESEQELDALLEKHAAFEKQHEQWNKEERDMDEAARVADAFAEEVGMKTLEISENEEGKKRK